MISFNPKDKEVPEVHKTMLGGIAPRPIAFVSTISKEGVVNLAPYSFFNAFGANPPMIAFSPARRGRGGTLKDTYNNLMDTKECVVHIVSYSMAQQMNLTSADFEENINEFAMAGFTEMDSDIVKAPRVKESVFHMECKLHQMVELGGKPGSGNLAICEVVRFHVAEEILTGPYPDPQKIDAIGRNGGNYYTRASGDAIFELPKPDFIEAIGYASIPEEIRNSDILTANNLGQIASLRELPTVEDSVAYVDGKEFKENTPNSFEMFERLKDHENMLSFALSDKSSSKYRSRLFKAAKTALDNGDVEFGSKVLIFAINDINT